MPILPNIWRKVESTGVGMLFYPNADATMADIELRMKLMDDEWSVIGEVGTLVCVVNVIFRKQEESDSDDESECDGYDYGGMTGCDNDNCHVDDYIERNGVHTEDGCFCSDECAAVVAAETN